MIRRVLLRGAVMAAALGALAGCSATYGENDLELLTQYRAKELCSCLFVMEQTEEFCARWTVAAPNLASFTIDYSAKRVSTAAVLMWGASAHWVGPTAGCVSD